MSHKTKNIRILRRPEVLTQTGLSKSTLSLRINQGLFCPPIPIGARSVGFVNYEVNEILAALISGKSDTEIKQIVQSLIYQRTELA
ncbi:MAG: AlpA family phage regulatory protein [Psychrobium sp.]|nr:AlpA family phage regulatory protein [Psychrobium sp.]